MDRFYFPRAPVIFREEPGAKHSIAGRDVEGLSKGVNKNFNALSSPPSPHFLEFVIIQKIIIAVNIK